MAAPTTAMSTPRSDLGGSMLEFDLQASLAGFIAQRVLPVLEVGKPSGPWYKIPIEQLLKIRNTDRAPGAGYNRGSFTFTPSTYSCKDRGLEEAVDDRERAMYRDLFDQELVTTLRARAGLLREMERRVEAAVFNATTWTGSALTTSVGTEWSTLATATPGADVLAAAKRVYNGSGQWPNALIINRKVFANLKQNAAIQNLIKYAGITDPRPANISAQAVAQALDIDQVIVCGEPEDTAKEGQTTTIASLWSDEYAMVAKVAVTSDPQEPCIGRIFHWAEDGSAIGGTVESYREEQSRSDIIRVRNDVDEQIMYVECGHLLVNITA